MPLMKMGRIVYIAAHTVTTIGCVTDVADVARTPTVTVTPRTIVRVVATVPSMV